MGADQTRLLERKIRVRKKKTNADLTKGNGRAEIRWDFVCFKKCTSLKPNPIFIPAILPRSICFTDETNQSETGENVIWFFG